MDYRLSALRRNGGALVLALLVGVTASLPAQAHRRDFPFTYDWHQAGKGEKEIESHTDYRWSDHSWEQQLELEYGISNRFMIAPYITYAREPGGHLSYSGFQVESRYQLGTEKTGRLLPGLYLEYEKPKGEKAEIEGKVILSIFSKKDEDLSLNLVTEKSTEHGAKTIYTYSFGYARPLGHGRTMPRGGFEFIRDIDDGRLNLGPVIGFEPWQKGMQRIAAVLGFGFPLDHRSGNKGEARLLIEYEWF